MSRLFRAIRSTKATNKIKAVMEDVLVHYHPCADDGQEHIQTQVQHMQQRVHEAFQAHVSHLSIARCLALWAVLISREYDFMQIRLTGRSQPHYFVDVAVLLQQRVMRRFDQKHPALTSGYAARRYSFSRAEAIDTIGCIGRSRLMQRVYLAETRRTGYEVGSSATAGHLSIARFEQVRGELFSAPS